ncbi:MAG: hypothetical protein GY778_12275, partial [bacterium]|nr:hypothetical protein [bacterium]
MRFGVVVVLLLPLFVCAAARAQDLIWSHAYGGAEDDFAYAGQTTSDGGFVVCGGTRSFGAGDMDVYLLKTDAAGDTLWTRTFGGVGYEMVWSVVEVAGGDFLLAGETSSLGAGGRDVYLLRIDDGGDTVWTRTYGGSGDDRAESVIQAPSGAIIVAGMTESFGAGAADIYVLSVDAAGDTLWTQTYGGTLPDEALTA